MHEGTTATRPRGQVFIKRPRLTKLLDESGARIILLLAPAGYGKTTLAREWTDEQDDVGWYTGAPGMVDVAGLSVGIAEVLAEMGGEPRSDMVERVRILAARGHDPRGLAKAVSGGAPGVGSILVVDDYHHALGSEDAEAFFEELVSRTEFRLVITSRDRPSWLPARKVVYGEAAVVEMDVLAFTDEEALAVLGESGSDILAEARGWPAVIGLAAMRGGTDVVTGLAPEELFRFFAEEMFRPTSPELRGALFLLGLADGVAGESLRSLLGPTHRELVEEATERGFLTRTGRQLVHPLVRSFLLTKLAELDEQLIRAAVSRAVDYLGQHHRWEDCLFVLERIPEQELIVSTLERGLAEMLDSGRVATVKGWLELADRERLSHPLFVLAAAEEQLRQGDKLGARVLGERAGGLLQGDLAARAYLAAARAAHLVNSPKLDEVDRLVNAVLNTPGAATQTQTNALWISFSSHGEFFPENSSEALDRLEALPGLDGDPNHALRLITGRGIALLMVGRTSEGLPVLQEAEALILNATDPFARTNTRHFLACGFERAAQYDEALRAALQLTEEGEVGGLDFAVQHGLLRQMAARIGMRQIREAQRVLAAFARIPTKSGFVVDNIAIQRAKLAIAAGDLEKAENVLARFSGSERLSFRGEVAGYRSIVASARGDDGRAIELLKEDESCFRQGEPSSVRTVSRAILAAKGLVTEQSLTEILSELFRAGMLDVIVTGYRAYPSLAVAGAQIAAVRQDLTDLLIRARDADIAKAAGLTVRREHRQRGPLSAREQEVFDLLIQGRPNREIARTLFISESTTKVHVQHIFEKLGIHSRVEAARLARLDDL
jgi:LuxR family transcriptional regulator, maltose regulon positive regulatory protein